MTLAHFLALNQQLAAKLEKVARISASRRAQALSRREETGDGGLYQTYRVPYLNGWKKLQY
jgi:hypothetical protein